MMGGLLALIMFRAKALALLTFIAFFAGEKLAGLSRFNLLADKAHGFTAALGRKLNRPSRSVATRVYRGITALIILEIPALAAAVLLSSREPWVELLAALVVVALLGRGYATATLFNRWQKARSGTLTLDADDTLFADTHGVLRHTIATSAEQFSTRVVGAGFWYVAGGLPMMFAYLTLAMAAAHYTALRQENRAFGWAADKLYRIADAVPRILTATFLLIGGCFVPRLRPINSLKSLFSSNRSWLLMVAELLDISLGSRMVSEAGEVELPWQGKGTAKLTPEHLTGWLALLGVATLLWLLTLLLLPIL